MAAAALFPTFTRIGRALWTSPTFTTWGNYAAQSLRLLLVTPLILTRFNETEIAAWYLFASLNFFGTTLSQRLGLTFSRMFAFAMGGASNLAPIKGKRAQENEGQPDWQAFERAYGTMGSINLGVAGLNVLIALGMGWFGLSNLLAGYNDQAAIWAAFAIIQAASFFQFVYQRYAIALRGMNYVALANRWGIVFALLSVAVGSGALLLGGDIIILAAVMQAVSLAGLLRNWFLLRHVQAGRVSKMQGYQFDRKVFSWAWEPSWKGFIGQMGSYGATTFVLIIYAGIGEVGKVAATLLAYRLLDTATTISNAPISSSAPKFSRLIAKKEHLRVRRIFINKLWYSLITLLVATATIAFLLVATPEYLNFSISFVPLDFWLAMCVLRVCERTLTHTIGVSGFSNTIVGYWRIFLAGAIGIIIFPFTASLLGFWALILSIDLPKLIMLNIEPFRVAKRALDLGWKQIMVRACPVFIATISALIITILL